MTRFDPFREIEELTQRMNHAFEQNQASGQAHTRLAPPIDIHENEQGLELSIDLPGIDPNSLQLEAENQTLTVQAERKYERKEGRTAHRVERAYGTFSRTFSVPAKYNLTKVEADFDHGTLSLYIPRSESAQKRSISVRTGGQILEQKSTVSSEASHA